VKVQIVISAIQGQAVEVGSRSRQAEANLLPDVVRQLEVVDKVKVLGPDSILFIFFVTYEWAQ
jgi:hypothetical protein